jgi:hypothetical protein
MAMNVVLHGESTTEVITQADGNTHPAVKRIKVVDGAVSIHGLSVNQLVQGAGTYSSTEILGYRVLVQGSGNWAQTPVNGTAQTIPFAAQVVGNVNPEHLSAITVGTAGSALLYIPAA